jgi:hypothetical protein
MSTAGGTRSTATHIGGTAQMAWLQVAAAPAGLVLGRDTQQSLVPVRLFREEPVRVTVIGGWWLTSLLVFRTLATGARVVVCTAAAERWHALAQAAQGCDRLAVLVGEQPVDVPATWANPVLLVDDFGPAGPSQRVNLAPWQTHLTVLPRLTTAGLGSTGAATLVIAQRLSAIEAGSAADLLRLSDETTSLLQVMHDDMVALIGGGADRYVWVSVTSVEQHFFGPAHRSG